MLQALERELHRPPQKTASSASTSSYSVDTNWYMDSGATDHVTSELKKVTTREKYNRQDQVHTASGSGMDIRHVGSSILHTPNSSIHLNKILHVPQAHKNLVFVHRLARDNDVFLEFHPDNFFIKDQDTRSTILEGRCEKGLYPLKVQQNKQALGVTKASTSLWHHRLGHASSHVVHQILQRHKLPFIRDLNKHIVCDACQKGKSHQLPYPNSFSSSSTPLELVHLDVWGLAPTSVGRNNYYVSFIDDYSKFT